MEQQTEPAKWTHILHLVRVDPDDPLPLVAQLRQQLALLIASGELAEGDRLPPVRELAQHLGINWHTIRAAYKQLAAERLVTVRQGRGTLVLPYTAHRAARPAPGTPTFTLGILLPSLNPIYAPFIGGIEQAARETPWLPLVCYHHDDPDLTVKYLDQLLARQVDGLILVSIDQQFVPPTLARDSLPIVQVDNPQASGYAVLLDSQGAAYRATHHLLEHGHRRIGLLSGPLDWPNVHECYLGYQRALASAFLEPDPHLVVETSTFHLDAGYQGGQRLLNLVNRPTAIFCTADILAIGAMRALQAGGVRIPDDVAVIGYNNIDLAALVEPPLTTVSAPAYEMGLTAMTMLHRLLLGQPVENRRVVLDARLVVRQSCGCRKESSSGLCVNG